MSHAASDRNLLFGILALQMDFVRRDDLIGAMNAWVLDKARPLGQILCERGNLTDERQALLDALVQAHLKQHGDDAQRSLAAVSTPRPLRDELKEIADPDVQSTLSSVSSVTPFSNGAAPPPTGPCRYRRLRLHAHGGLGDVYVAEDMELHREVALKEIRAHRADDPESRSRFVVEAEVTGGLEHPGVVPVYGLGSYADGRPYYAMRFIRGDSLKAAIEQFHADEKQSPGERRLAFRQLLRRFVDACNAVAYAHSRGVLHRDLKPANIMLGKFGETLVVDWGLAKAGVRRSSTEHAVEATTDPTFHPGSGSDQHATQAGAALGTPTYMSPEQAAGKVEEVGPASDVYGLGATLYVLLTGHRPFRGETPDEVLGQVRSGKLAPPREVRPDVPPALDAVCRKAMAFRPAERYASALEMAADIEHWLADEPVSVYAEPWPARAGRWGRRHRTAVVAVTVFLTSAVVALSVGTTLVWSERQKAADHKRLADQNFATASDLSFTAFDLMTKAEVIFAANTALQPFRKKFMTTSARAFRDILAQQPDDPDRRQQTAKVFRYTANMHRFHNEIAEAEVLYRDGIGLLEGLSSQFPSVPVYRKDLAETVRDYAPLLEKAGRLREAAATLERALALSRQLAIDEPDVPDHRRNVATALVDLCNADYGQGRLEDCGRHAAESVALFGELSRLPPEKQHPYNPLLLAAAHNWAAIAAREAGRLEEAAAEHREALRLLKPPPPGVNSRDAAHFLAACQLDEAKTRARTPAQRAAAEAALADPIAAWETLQKTASWDSRYREWLGLAYQERARLRAEAGQLTAARADYERSRDLLEGALPKKDDVPGVRGDLGRTYAGLAEVARKVGNVAAASEAEAKAVAALQRAVELSPDNTWDRRSLEAARAPRP